MDLLQLISCSKQLQLYFCLLVKIMSTQSGASAIVRSSGGLESSALPWAAHFIRSEGPKLGTFPGLKVINMKHEPDLCFPTCCLLSRSLEGLCTSQARRRAALFCSFRLQSGKGKGSVQLAMGWGSVFSESHSCCRTLCLGVQRALNREQTLLEGRSLICLVGTFSNG